MHFKNAVIMGELLKYDFVGTCLWDLKSRPIFIPNFAKKMRPIFIPEPQILSKIY